MTKYEEQIRGMAQQNRGSVGIQEARPQPEQEPSFSVQQAYAMAQVCLDLHEALGCKWGDNPYLTITAIKEALAQPAPYMAVSNDRMSVDPHTGNVSIGTPPEKNT